MIPRSSESSHPIESTARPDRHHRHASDFHHFSSDRDAVANPAMGGQGAPPPIDQHLGWSWLCEPVCFKHGDKFSFKSLTFCHFLYENGQKTFSFPHQGLFPWTVTPLGAPPDPHLGAPLGKSWIRRCRDGTNWHLF